MLTRDDMHLLAQSLRSANQVAADKILPSVNQIIKQAAQEGEQSCSIDIPAVLDNAPAYEYAVVCQSIVDTLRKGRFTVLQKNLGIYDVSWDLVDANPASEDLEVKIVHSRKKRSK